MSATAPAGSQRSPRHSLRLRLTLWVVAVFTVIQITLSVVFFLYERNSVDSFFSTRLELSSRNVADTIAPNLPNVTDNDLYRLSRDALRFVVFEGYTIALYDDTGRLVAASHRPIPPAAAEVADSMVRASLADPTLRIIESPLGVMPDPDADAKGARVAVMGFQGRDGQRYALITATADTYSQRILNLAANVLIASLPIGIIAAAAAGWFIAGIATAPLRQIRRLATTISPETIDQHVEFDSTAAEMVHLEDEWNRMRRRMEAAFMAKERFMANVSHELKTPISVLLTEAQVLDLDEASEDVRDFVNSAQEELRRLARLVESFLLLTRSVAEDAPPKSEVVTVNDLVMESVDECGQWAALHHVYIVPTLLDDDTTIDATVEGDPDLLRTMLNNLVLNATRFSPVHEKVTITPRIEGDTVMIGVRDHGPGIPEPLLDRVFDRYVQAEDERRRGRGNGLGLEIARGIAELHHGEIRVQNRDPGCEFTACIPRHTPHTSPRDRAPTRNAG